MSLRSRPFILPTSTDALDSDVCAIVTLHPFHCGSRLPLGTGLESRSFRCGRDSIT
jgi:hypothetical protein